MTALQKGLRGVSALFVLSLVGSIAGYASRGFLARLVSPTEFGLFYSLFSLCMFLMMIAKCGLPTTAVKFIAQFASRKEFDKVKGVVFLSSGLRLFTTLIFVALLLLLSTFIAKVFIKQAGVEALIPLVALMFVLLTLNQILSTLFNSMQQNALYGFVDFFQKTLFVVLLMVGAWKGVEGVHLPLYAQVLASLVVFLCLFFPAVKVTRLLEHKATYTFTKPFLKFTSTIFFSSFTVILMGHIDTLMLTGFRSLEEVALYNALAPTVMLLAIVGSSLRDVFYPLAASLWATNKKKSLKEGFSMLQRYALAIVAPMALVFISFPEVVLRVLFGQSYVQGAQAMQVLAIGILFTAAISSARSLLRGIDRPKEEAKIAVGAALLNVLLNVVLIPMWGIVGAAVATTITYIIMFVLINVQLKRFLDLTFPLLLSLRIGFASLAFLGVVALCKFVLEVQPVIEAVICLCLATLVYGGCCLILKIVTKKELVFLKKALFS